MLFCNRACPIFTMELKDDNEEARVWIQILSLKHSVEVSMTGDGVSIQNSIMGFLKPFSENLLIHHEFYSLHLQSKQNNYFLKKSFKWDNVNNYSWFYSEIIQI